MLKDIPEVSLVRIDLTACGKKEMVVQVAAIKPMMVIKFMKTIFDFNKVKLAAAKYSNHFMNNRGAF